MANQTVAKSNPATGWTFDLVQDSSGSPASGGLIIKNVRHDAHNYARDIRVIGIWLRFDSVDHTNGRVQSSTWRFITLDPHWFTSTAISELNASPSAQRATPDVTMMNYFVPGYALQALYASTAAVFAGVTNSVYGSLLITQTWMFSAYGNSPPHEPSGGLSAARFHPVLEYRFDLSTSFVPTQDYTRVGSIRFDYRMHLRVDRSSSTPDATSAAPSNHPGLFRDRDAPPFSGASSSGTGFTYAAFDAAEKPLAREVIGPGLYQGLSTKDVGAAQGGPPRQQMELCWDNVHWWGHRASGHISAPGAFHAVHMHWRWGAPIALTGGILSTVGAAPPRPANIDNFLQPLPSVLRAEDYRANGTIYGAIVDPRIWIQTLLVAVTKHDSTLDPDRVALSNLSTQNFNDLFTGRGQPQDIYAGADCVLWYSTEVPYAVNYDIYYAGTSGPTRVPVFSGTRGAVFLHGTFFAHDPERTGKFIGDTAELYRARTLQQIQATPTWYRPPLI
jgi:hypothetical protein